VRGADLAEAPRCDGAPGRRPDGSCGSLEFSTGPGQTYAEATKVFGDNPADLTQPRGETPAYSARRSVVLDHYRKGEPTGTTYPNANAGKISDVGQ